MSKFEFVRQIMYALSIAIFGRFVTMQGAQYLHLQAFQLFLLLEVLAIVLLILGFFKFKKGLGSGLALWGIACAVSGSIPYWGNMSEILRFALALSLLLIIIFALYQLSKKASK